MRCRIALIALLLAAALRAAGPPPDERVSVNILSKHRLSACAVHVPSGTLYRGAAAIPLAKATLTIRREGGRFAADAAGQRWPLGDAHLAAEEGFTVSFDRGGSRETRAYRGALAISERGGTIRLVCTMPLEDYVRAAARDELGELLGGGVGRAPAGRELAAAMEIVVRSYVVRNRDRHRADGYQLCDLTHCIHFGGLRDTRAAGPTAGLVLTDERGAPLDAFFHSCCGGELAGPETWWPGTPAGPRYRRGADRRGLTLRDSCAASPHHDWRAPVGIADLAAILGTSDVRQCSTALTGRRVTALSWRDGSGAPHRMAVARFMSRAGRRLGWNVIKSNYFTLRQTAGGYLFEGHGLGHGVGLCQWGAQGLARRGYSWREIINHYYPGARVAPLRMP